MVAYENFGLCSPPQSYEQTPVGHKIDSFRAAHIDYLDRFIQHHVVGYIDEYPVLSECRIESHKRIGIGTGCTGIISSHKFRILQRHVVQSSYHHTFGHGSRSFHICIKRIIDREYLKSAYIGHIAFE